MFYFLQIHEIFEMNSLRVIFQSFRKSIFVLSGLIFTMNLISCDSPRNHQIKAYGLQPESNVQSYSFSTFEYTVKPIWSLGPYASLSKASQLVVLVYDSNGQLVDLPEDLTLGFFGIMPSMGHGLEDAGYFERISMGIYENKNIFFQMSGNWQIELSILNQNYDELDKVLWLEFF
jgi:hypothetical protein